MQTRSASPGRLARRYAACPWSRAPCRCRSSSCSRRACRRCAGARATACPALQPGEQLHPHSWVTQHAALLTCKAQLSILRPLAPGRAQGLFRVDAGMRRAGAERGGIATPGRGCLCRPARQQGQGCRPSQAGRPAVRPLTHVGLPGQRRCMQLATRASWWLSSCMRAVGSPITHTVMQPPERRRKKTTLLSGATRAHWSDRPR